MLCAFRRAASTLARLPLIFSDHLVPLHSEVCASFSNDASYAVLSGDHERGFNACVELCDRHVGSGTALRFLSATGEVEEFDFATLRARASRFADLLTAMGVRPGERAAGLLPRPPDLLTDRTSAWSGTSVSLRVDLGVRRI